MTSFTTNIYLRPGGVKSFSIDIKSFFQVGRMTISTHAVPVLTQIGPVKPVGMLNDFIRINSLSHMIPGL